MLFLCFAAFYVVAVCAESPSIGSYSSQGGSSLRDYEYTAGRSGESYIGAKPSYGEFAGSYVSLTGAPYSKGETRYTSTASDGNSDSSSETRTSLTASVSSGSNGAGNSASNSGSNSAGNFYKAKYASDATINAIRPSYQSLPGSSLAAPTSSATSEEAALQGQNQATGPSSSYYGHEQQLQSAYAASGEPASHSEYVSVQGRPSTSVYSGYAANSAAGEYVHSRPSSYNFGGLSAAAAAAAASQMAMSDYSSGSRHHVHASYPVSDEPSYQGHAMPAPASSHPYKSYILSNPPSSYSSSKYQTVLGALKSLFGGGGNAGSTEAAASPSHPPSYLAAAGPGAGPGAGPHGYYSPTPMHSASHHAPALMSPLSSVQASPSSHYFSSGSGTSNSQFSTAYSKNYPSMRLMSNYGLHSGSSGSLGGPGSPGKLILLRDSSLTHGATYPSAAASLLPSHPAAYAAANAAAKNKISYISAAPSSLSYNTAHSAAYPGSASFPSNHGGSTFLGYSAN